MRARNSARRQTSKAQLPGAGALVAQIAPLVAGARGDDPPIVVPFCLSTPLGEVSMFTTLTTFGTPRDITLEELSIELFYPADDASEDLKDDGTASGADADASPEPTS